MGEGRTGEGRAARAELHRVATRRAARLDGGRLAVSSRGGASTAPEGAGEHGGVRSPSTSTPWIEIQPLDRPPDAVVEVPGSKSMTNRALLAAALAPGASTLSGALVADDTEAMVGCLHTLGVEITRGPEATTILVQGGGSLRAERPLDARQSGTTARFLLPVAALAVGRVVLDGDPQLRSRPMAPGLDALLTAGVHVEELGEPGHLPVAITGPFRRKETRVDGGVSSQFLSGLLLAGVRIDGGLTVSLTGPLVSASYVESSVEIIRAFGGSVREGPGWWHVEGPRRDARHGKREDRRGSGDRDADGSGRGSGGRDEGEWRGESGEHAGNAGNTRSFRIEPDASSAAYLLAAAALTGGRVRVPGLDASSTQADLRFLDVLAAMGAEVRFHADGVEVRGPARLTGVDVDLSACSDAAPTLGVLAAFAEGETRARGIGFIRRKESDRIAAVVTELTRLGVAAEVEEDGFVVRPGPARSRPAPTPVVVETYRDHRIAMAFALAGLVRAGVRIADPACVAKTFPDYFAALDQLRR